ncbi:MAG TPA: hypothetical protein ENN06_09565 [Desulfobacteraceae bacterium]|mgnify:CR=1 FL=1|nr:hypothetical protein [Desulfobacteraceae bacterium]
MNKLYFSEVRSILLALSAVPVLLSFVPAAHGLQQHREIEGPFESVRDMSAQCIACHRQQANEVLASTHWTWSRKAVINGESVPFGKNDSLAGFAIDVAANASRCTACHISSDRGNVNPKAPSPDALDCLVCHDTTGRYRLSSSPAPSSEPPFDLGVIARNVGRPNVKNCLICHFADCGLPSSPAENRLHPEPADIHMRADGGNFSCQTCHDGGHALFGHRSRADDSSSAGERCAGCHSGAPHDMAILNKHGESVSCRTCHIRVEGGGTPVLVGWNWIMAGRGVPVHLDTPGGRLRIRDRNGAETAINVEPVYLWDDGSDTAYRRGQRIQPGEMTVLQGPAPKSDRSKITPFRVMHATQLYDRKYRYLISPLLNADGPELFPADGPVSLAEDGMKALVLPYSGQYDYTATVRYKRISHGVAPAEQALGCLDCHGRSGRMNWAELGFDGDPWPNGLIMQEGGEQPGDAATNSGPPTRPPAETGTDASPPADDW